MANRSRTRALCWLGLLLIVAACGLVVVKGYFDDLFRNGMGPGAISNEPQASIWMYWRTSDLKRGVETFTTNEGWTHTYHVSICAPDTAYVCMRTHPFGTLAVPRGGLPDTWEFEGARYEVFERRAGLELLGEAAEGVYIKTSASNGGPLEFLYSPTRGFVAFQWARISQGPATVYVSVTKCAPGAASSCREK